MSGKAFAALSAALSVALLVMGIMLYRAENRLARARSDLGRLETAARARQVRNEEQARQAQRTESALARREVENREAAAAKEQRRGDWETMRRTDENVRDWADRPLPESVFRLREKR